MSTATAPAPSDAARGGKYLTFFLGEEEYGVAILKVQEIISMQPITRVPRAPAFIRGVLNLRGRVIPVVDLRERFGMPPCDGDAAAPAPDSDGARAAALRCIVVVETVVRNEDAPGGGAARRLPMGVIVDRVSEVAAVDEADVEDPPSFGRGVRTEYLLGIAKSRAADRKGGAGRGDDSGRVRLLLDLDRVLSPDESAQLPAAVDEAA